MAEQPLLLKAPEPAKPTAAKSVKPSALAQDMASPIANAPNRGGRPLGKKDSKPRAKGTGIPLDDPRRTPDFSDVNGKNPLPTPEPAQPGAAPIQEHQVQPGTVQVDYAGLANFTFDTSLNAAVAIFGPEWNPRRPEEKMMIVQALENYYRTKKTPDLPPGVLLAIVISMYAAPRFTMPQTRNRMAALLTWCKVKWGNFRGKKGPMAPHQIRVVPPPPQMSKVVL